MELGTRRPLAIDGPAATGAVHDVDSILLRQNALDTLSIPDIDNLRDDSDNWFAWKTRMLIILECYGALEVALGQLPRPAKRAGAAAWDSRDKFAKVLIVVNIEDEQVLHVAECTTSAEMWANLQAVNELRWQLSIVSMKGQLYSMRARKGAHVPEHVDKMLQLRNKLASAGRAIEDNEFRLLLLLSVPPSCEGYAMRQLYSIRV